ncbi:MAG: hypothetical protein H8E46_06420, partial [FCB group bacterium]|nr:hypothetical protein [FCB group bacterium]
MLIRIALYLSVLISILLLFTGCEITESEVPPTGDIYVSSEDASGAVITGGQIYLDNILQGQTTPATFNGVGVGDHLIKVKKTIVNTYVLEHHLDADRLPPGGAE